MDYRFSEYSFFTKDRFSSGLENRLKCMDKPSKFGGPVKKRTAYRDLVPLCAVLVLSALNTLKYTTGKVSSKPQQEKKP